MSLLIDDFDGALFDLDGVVYLGPVAVPGAAQGLQELRQRDVRIGFVTNNAARPPQVVAEQLQGLGIQASSGDIVTSAQSAAALAAELLPAGSSVLVTGTSALRDEITARGFTLVDDWRDHPDAVVQGFDPQVTWPTLAGTAHAVQGGARWIVANTDLNRPTDLGLEPGTGAQVYVVGVCLPPDVTPDVSGKPYPPLLRETMRRLDLHDPIFVGDRLDTDIEGAHNVQIASLWVTTGAHHKLDLLYAVPQQRPSYIGADLRALLQPARTAQVESGRAVCGQQEAIGSGTEIALSHGVPDELEAQLDALWALLQLAWAANNPDGARAAVESLNLIP